MQIIVDDLAVNYRLNGDGRIILLLHGWGDSLFTFDNLSKSLAVNNRVIALDLPGFGGSEAPKTVWGLDDYCNFLKHFLEKLGLGMPYAIIGHSNGGALAIRGLATKTLKAERLVLLAAAGVRDTHKVKKAATKAVAKVGKATSFWLPNQQRQKLRLKLYGTIGSDLMVMPKLQETFKKTVSQDVQADAARLNLKCLLIYADHDPAIPIEDGRIYNRLIKESNLVILTGNDHFIHHDQPEKIESLIKDFLK